MTLYNFKNFTQARNAFNEKAQELESKKAAFDWLAETEDAIFKALPANLQAAARIEIEAFYPGAVERIAQNLDDAEAWEKACDNPQILAHDPEAAFNWMSLACGAIDEANKDAGRIVEYLNEVYGELLESVQD